MKSEGEGEKETFLKFTKRSEHGWTFMHLLKFWDFHFFFFLPVRIQYIGYISVLFQVLFKHLLHPCKRFATIFSEVVISGSGMAEPERVRSTKFGIRFRFAPPPEWLQKRGGHLHASVNLDAKISALHPNSYTTIRIAASKGSGSTLTEPLTCNKAEV